MACLELYQPKGKNGVIYGLKEAGNAYFELDTLWFNPLARADSDLKFFYKAVTGYAEVPNTDRTDQFHDEHCRHEFNNRIFAIPNRETFTTQLRAYFIRYSPRTIIYVAGAYRTVSCPIQEDPDLAPKLTRWLDIITDLDMVVKDPANRLYELPDGGFARVGSTELVKLIQLP